MSLEHLLITARWRVGYVHAPLGNAVSDWFLVSDLDPGLGFRVSTGEARTTHCSTPGQTSTTEPPLRAFDFALRLLIP